jgi:hypothetical protein
VLSDDDQTAGRKTPEKREKKKEKRDEKLRKRPERRLEQMSHQAARFPQRLKELH